MLNFLLALGDIGYTRFPESCVNGRNIIKYANKSVDECKALCSLNEFKTSEGELIKRDCVAFEYGVDYGGEGAYKPRDCQPSDGSDRTGCDGPYQNLDLYVKGVSYIC